MYDFQYLIKKIMDAAFTVEPFEHIYIEDFFSDDHFAEIIGSDEIRSPSANTDTQLIDELYSHGFKAINFPGCVDDPKEYIKWRKQKDNAATHTATEGMGMALRLYEFRTPILKQINDFMVSDEFNKAIAEKFNIDFDSVKFDGGIQKYLDGYEISPHPDIRKKAATFMVNINPNEHSEGADHHTHYMKLKDKYTYVEALWRGNPDIERAWVPWNWAITMKQQTKNNSIVLFSPDNDTLHAVKTDYDHLVTQRTQLYGNLWFKESPRLKKLEWEQLDITEKSIGKTFQQSNVRHAVAQYAPNVLKQLLGRKVGNRNL